MRLRPEMTPHQRLNFVRRVPSEQVLTPAEAGLYTGIFSSRGYDSKNAYNYYEREAYDRRSGYLRGLGADKSMWDTVRDWFGANAAADVPSDEDMARVDCTGRSTDDCLALIEAARGRVTTTERDITRTEAREGPATGLAWATAVKWIAVAGAVGLGAYALSEVFGGRRR